MLLSARHSTYRYYSTGTSYSTCFVLDDSRCRWSIITPPNCSPAYCIPHMVYCIPRASPVPISSRFTSTERSPGVQTLSGTVRYVYMALVYMAFITLAKLASLVFNNSAGPKGHQGPRGSYRPLFLALKSRPSSVLTRTTHVSNYLHVARRPSGLVVNLHTC